MTEKKINYTEKDKVIVSILKDSEVDLTIAEISAIAGMPIAPGTMTSAVNKGLIAVSGKKTVERPAKRKVAEYSFVTDEVATTKNGKPANYTDGEKSIMKVLKDSETPMTLAEIASALGKNKLTSGAINGLVSKGNVAKAGEREVEVIGKAEVNTYEFVADVPETR